MKVFIVGSGSWGTALASVLTDNGEETLIYGVAEDEMNDININHKNSKYFGDLVLDEKIKATSDITKVNEFDIVLLSVPSKVSVTVAKQINDCLNHQVIVVNVAKGFNPENYHRLSVDVSAQFTDGKLLAYSALLGPSHAEEVIQKMQTAVNVVCENDEIAIMLQHLFANEYFRVYRNNDMIGCEYGAGLKNIIAMASGILYGLGLGDNAKALLMTRGLAEMTRFGVAKGANKETFMGLCGMGDLIVTCTSVHSRNWQAGYLIGKENSAEQFWATNTKTVEGVDACKIIYKEAKEEGIEMPITDALYSILFEGQEPSKISYELMTRSLKSEIG